MTVNKNSASCGLIIAFRCPDVFSFTIHPEGEEVGYYSSSLPEEADQEGHHRQGRTAGVLAGERMTKTHRESSGRKARRLAYRNPQDLEHLGKTVVVTNTKDSQTMAHLGIPSVLVLTAEAMSMTAHTPIGSDDDNPDPAKGMKRKGHRGKKVLKGSSGEYHCEPVEDLVLAADVAVVDTMGLARLQAVHNTQQLRLIAALVRLRRIRVVNPPVVRSPIQVLPHLLLRSPYSGLRKNSSLPELDERPVYC